MLAIQIIKNVAGKFVPKSDHIDTRGDFLEYNVMSVSLKARKEIEEKYFKFFQEVRSIVELDQGDPEEVQILNIQLLSLTDMVRAE